MCRTYHLAPLLLVLVPVPSFGAEKPSDAEITKLIVGRWESVVEPGEVSPVVGMLNYVADGTFKAEGKADLGGGVVADVRVEGTWKVAGGVVVLRVTKSSKPGLAPVGAQVKEKVISIDDEALCFKRGIGNVKTRKRVKE